MILPFQFTETELKDLYLIRPFVAEDNRGAFIKDYSSDTFKQMGLPFELVEVFYTVSHKNVLRGMHFQRVQQQPKLVRCIKGQIFDVVCDLRKDSGTFGEWRSFELTGDNHLELLIPAGFAHGYYVLEDSIVSYKCAEKFYSEFDDGIIWNDSKLAITWPCEDPSAIILSEKDKALQTFSDFCHEYQSL